jgi:xylulokinase
MQRVESTPAGSRGVIFLPYLTGERSPVWDPKARGAFVGLTLSHGADEMARAVAESIGFAIRDVLEVMSENNLVMQEIRVAGSQSQIEVLNQIKADISGKRLLIPAVAESELMGDACVGLVALGEFESLQAACRACIKIGREFNPDSRNLALYAEMFYLYRDIYSGLKGTFHKLAAGTDQEDS